MMKKAYFVYILAALLASSCSDQKSKSEVLVQANNLHMESVSIHEKVEEALRERQKLARAANDAGLMLKLDSLQQVVELWETGVEEVPGFEHEHHHEKAAHVHKPAMQMTDQSMLEYQQHTKNAIEEIQKELENIH